ncbi:MAG: hypothetical protein AAF465_06635 [Pseudomonadota bacterium]
MWPLIVCMLMAACSDHFLPRIETTRDTVASWRIDDNVTLEIDSPSGIGTLRIQHDGSWPDAIYIDLSLAGLEHFAVHHGTETHSLSVTEEGLLRSPPSTKVLYMDNSESHNRLDTVRLIIWPNALAQPVRDLRIEWVDFYR